MLYVCYFVQLLGGGFACASNLHQGQQWTATPTGATQEEATEGGEACAEIRRCVKKTGNDMWCGYCRCKQGKGEVFAFSAAVMTRCPWLDAGSPFCDGCITFLSHT